MMIEVFIPHLWVRRYYEASNAVPGGRGGCDWGGRRGVWDNPEQGDPDSDVYSYVYLIYLFQNALIQKPVPNILYW